MRIVILLYCVWLASAGTAPDKCDGVTFNGKYYDKEVLLTNIGNAGGFSLDKSTNTLFFSYIYPQEHIDIMGIAYYNIDTKEFKDLPEVYLGWATAINPETGDVYLAGSDVIYRFNSLNKTAVPYYAAQGVDIYSLYYSKLLYYTTSLDYEIYSYDGKETKKVSNITVQKLIRNEEKYFFINSTGLYTVLDDKEEDAEKLSDVLCHFGVFAKDNNNKIFVTGDNRVYVINEENKKLDKIADIEKIRDLVFDQNNNIIYSDNNSIYRLTPR